MATVASGRYPDHVTKTVLLADDSTTIQRVVELAFAGRDDVRVVSVGDGEEAIARIRQTPPDLVLADIAMPYRSGYDVAEWVQEQAAPGTMPVLLLSGAFEAVDQERARSVGAAGIITKPIDPAVLLARVGDLLRRADERAPEPASDAVAAPPPTPAWPEQVEAAEGAVVPAAPQVPASAPDQYFDEIDRAFANLKHAPRPPLPPEPETEADSDELADLLPVTPVAAPPVASPLQDAFATLLDAERTGAVVLPLGRIALAPPTAPSAPAIDVNALADQIARRVLQQLSDRVVRETVADIVSSTTERLVRDEIERIKRHIT